MTNCCLKGYILWKKLSKLWILGSYLSTIKSLYTDDSVDCLAIGLSTRPVYAEDSVRVAFPPSPLCSLHHGCWQWYQLDPDWFHGWKSLCIWTAVRGWLGACCKVCCWNKSLLSRVKLGFNKLKLTISVKKSQVISPSDDDWEVTDPAGNVVLSLEQVELKYLGTWTYNTMYRTSVD